MGIITSTFAALLLPVFYLICKIDPIESFATPQSEFILDIDGIAVTAGREHACLLEQLQVDGIGGKAQCWGYDDHGQTEAPADMYFVQLATGNSFSCGITVEQQVHCWGGFEGEMSGQISGLYMQINADGGGRFACGVMTDGNIHCWGHVEFNKKIIPKEDNLKFLQISCSRYHCCALDSNAYPHCFGRWHNAESVVPMVSYKDFLDGNHLPIELQVVDDEDEGDMLMGDDATAKVQFRQLSVSDGVSCGISLIGSHLRCWGSLLDQKEKKEKSGRIRNEVSALPRFVEGPFRQISVGGAGLCAIFGDLSIDQQEGVHEPLTVPSNRISRTATSDSDNTQIAGGITVDSASEQGSSSPSTANNAADSLRCWGTAFRRVNSTFFEAWDQISVSATGACGVSMNSEIECFGLIVPTEVQDKHRQFLAA